MFAPQHSAGGAANMQLRKTVIALRSIPAFVDTRQQNI
jgi:hypothetical protein